MCLYIVLYSLIYSSVPGLAFGLNVPAHRKMAKWVLGTCMVIVNGWPRGMYVTAHTGYVHLWCFFLPLYFETLRTSEIPRDAEQASSTSLPTWSTKP